MNRKGFTLVELAIVLVIIGVILGGVIKGQELVTNAKIKRLYRDYQQVEFAYFSYYDRYNEVAGDGTGTGADKDDGFLDSGASTSRFSATTGTEVTVFWLDERTAGFYNDGVDISTPANGLALPNHALGGSISVNSKQFGFTKNVVCLHGLVGEDAEIFDSQFDDGDATTGNIRAATALATGAPTAAYVAATTDYIACLAVD